MMSISNFTGVSKHESLQQGLVAQSASNTSGLIVVLSADEFYRQSKERLKSHPGMNHFLLHAASSSIHSHFSDKQTIAIMSGLDSWEGSALFLPNGRLYLSSEVSEQTLYNLSTCLQEKEVKLTSVLASSESVERFASLWGKLTLQFPVRENLYFAYEAQRFLPSCGTPGFLRRADINDLETIDKFGAEFEKENNCHISDQMRLELIKKGLEERAFYLWIDHAIVSMVRSANPTTEGLEITYGYTPPEFRGHGYSPALLSNTTNSILQEGLKYCVIFTDKENPVTNKIYPRCGYEKVGELLSVSY